jgi:hypothetical protein
VIGEFQQPVVVRMARGAQRQMGRDAGECLGGVVLAELGLDVALEDRTRCRAARLAVIATVR